MGACFSREKPNEQSYTRFEKTVKEDTYLSEDNMNEIMQSITLNDQRQSCCFASNCNRKNLDGALNFSYYNETIALKEQCCKVYPLIGGGRVSSFQEKLDENIVKKAGCALIIGDSIVFVIEIDYGKLNFPCGKRNSNEKSLFCAFRQTKDELGFNPFQSGIRLGHKWTFVRSHTSRKTGKKSQSVIYVFDHSQSIDWFNENFNFNKECSDIVVMPISLFIQNVEKRPEIFILPESMKKFAEQLKDRMSI